MHDKTALVINDEDGLVVGVSWGWRGDDRSAICLRATRCECECGSAEGRREFRNRDREQLFLLPQVRQSVDVFVQIVTDFNRSTRPRRSGVAAEHHRACRSPDSQDPITRRHIDFLIALEVVIRHSPATPPVFNGLTMLHDPRRIRSMSLGFSRPFPCVPLADLRPTRPPSRVPDRLRVLCQAYPSSNVICKARCSISSAQTDPAILIASKPFLISANASKFSCCRSSRARVSCCKPYSCSVRWCRDDPRPNVYAKALQNAPIAPCLAPASRPRYLRYLAQDDPETYQRNGGTPAMLAPEVVPGPTRAHEIDLAMRCAHSRRCAPCDMNSAWSPVQQLTLCDGMPDIDMSREASRSAVTDLSDIAATEVEDVLALGWGVDTKPTLLVPCVCSASSGEGHNGLRTWRMGYSVENMLLEGPAPGMDAVELQTGCV
ncbi:hypothetical protein FB567DRAFT_546731 [Paraphoma chrysanthemicola]|uniref:Uncharacterized protein n=1 Tax=Paraphoma chrysanthemicola TaxID=798071 RepID=A0A8K0RB99_9PLEO|nr:hypothetical protein FB567DRAFT_546731 [Paraphoma chrysanthemicola]